MRFLLAVAAVLLPHVSAQDPPVFDDPLCTEDGFPAVLLRTGVFIEFLNSEVTCNNLGDMGPQTDCPSELRYTNIGTDFGMDVGPGDDIPVDLVVTNLTEYKANNPERNGRTENGIFGQINLRDDFETEFLYTFVVIGGDPNNPADVVTFTTGVELFVLDIDFGEAMRLTESLKFFPPEGESDLPLITSINEACTDNNQPTPCLMTTVFIEQFASPLSINCTATDRGVGGDNPKEPGQILQPVADMDDFDRLAATRYVNVSYPPNMGAFRVVYKVTAAAAVGSSGRNFQLFVQGMGAIIQAPVPCYFCDPRDPITSPPCLACGGSEIVDGDVVLFPTKCPVDPNDDLVLFRPDCFDTEAAVCTPDAGADSTFPECLATCAVQCLENEPFLCPAPPDLNPPTPPPPPDVSPSPPPSPPMGMARKDPHLYFPHGGRADFRGARNTTFAMLSAKDVAFNVLTEEADFNWAKRLVHGTKMAAAFWVVRTSTGRVLKVELNATSRSAVVHEDGERDVDMKDDILPAMVVDNVQVSFDLKTLTVTVADKWHLTATITAFPFGNRAANKNKRLLDISIDALYDADHDVVAPHGIMGQAYDGDDISVSGKVDTEHQAESTTSAQAEGAIEGSWLDYKLASPFATDFKYSRFDATEAKPRDASKLTGEKAPAAKTKGVVGATDVPVVI